MKIAVIILNYNSLNDCQKCIAYLKQQKNIQLELIVVDNCSDEPDKVKVLCKEQECTFLSSKENHGYNAGNNIGLRYAAQKGYEYALISNPDMEFPDPNYISKLIGVMYKDPNIVVAGSDIIGPDNIHQNPLNLLI